MRQVREQKERFSVPPPSQILFRDTRGSHTVFDAPEYSLNMPTFSIKPAGHIASSVLKRPLPKPTKFAGPKPLPKPPTRTAALRDGVIEINGTDRGTDYIGPVRFLTSPVGINGLETEHEGRDTRASSSLARVRTPHTDSSLVNVNPPAIRIGSPAIAGPRSLEDPYHFVCPRRRGESGTLGTLTCARCGYFIEGKILNDMSKRFHPSCFCCAACEINLEQLAFHDKDGAAYCYYDYHELFTILKGISGL